MGPRSGARTPSPSPLRTTSVSHLIIFRVRGRDPHSPGEVLRTTSVNQLTLVVNLDKASVVRLRALLRGRCRYALLFSNNERQPAEPLPSEEGTT